MVHLSMERSEVRLTSPYQHSTSSLSYHSRSREVGGAKRGREGRRKERLGERGRGTGGRREWNLWMLPESYRSYRNSEVTMRFIDRYSEMQE